MQVFINDREISSLAATQATVGEVVEALGAHVDPREIVTEVVIDGEVFSAGDEVSYARRSAASVSRLGLTTSTVPALVVDLREEVRQALRCITAKLEAALTELARGETRAAHRVLAQALEELRLTLVLDQQTVQLGGGRGLTTEAEIAPVAEDLLAAQDRRDIAATRTLLADRLVPLLRGWGAAVDPEAPQRTP